MIGVRLMGGLGNQMFQYALARSLAEKRHTRPILDLVFFEGIAETDTPREYELNAFVVNPIFLPSEKRPGEPIPVYAGPKGIARKIKHRAQGKAWSIYREPHYHFDKNVLAKKNGTYLIGFWQCEKYFSTIRPLLLKDFALREPLGKKAVSYAKKIELAEASISLHVRRGDYITNPHANKHHGTKDNSYYKQAFAEIKKRDNTKKYTVFVFSDDIVWCKKNIKLPADIVFVSGTKSGAEDMYLMSLCKHNIIANSSFSWWGAWLNQNPKKLVVGPKKWFNKPGVNTSDVLPQSWIRI